MNQARNPGPSTAAGSDLPLSKGLPRSLGLGSAMAITVGTMIGTGIYLKPGEVAARAGSLEWAVLAWLAGGALSLAGALIYLELATAMPATGADCEYLKRGLSPLFGFLYGWKSAVVNGPTSIAALASAAVLFATALLPALRAPVFPGQAWAATRGQWLAVAVILLFSAVNLLASRAVGRVQVVLTLLKVGSILAVAGIGLFAPEGAAVPPPAATPAPSQFAAAVSASLWAYSGWHILLRVGGEVADPGRNLPRAILFGFLGTACLFLLVNLACFRVLSFDQLAQSRTAVADMLGRVGGAGLAVGLTLAMILSALGTLNGTILTQSRIPYAMARDGLLPRVLGTVSATGRAPVGAVLYKAGFAAVLVLTGTFEQLSSLYVFAQWLFYALGALALLRLRAIEPDLARPVRVPGFPLLPILFTGAAAWLTLQGFLRDPVRSGIGLGLILLGVPVYLMLRRAGPGTAANLSP